MIAKGEFQIVVYDNNLPALNPLLEVDGITHVEIVRTESSEPIGMSKRTHVAVTTYHITIRFIGDIQHIVNTLVELMPKRTALA